MSSEQNAYFEKWVRQEQLAYWFIALVLIGISVAAFLAFQPDSMNSFESNIGTIQLEQGPRFSFTGYVIMALPAFWGLFMLYWTSSRDHVRALTSTVMHHQVLRWFGLGLVFGLMGASQLFGGNNVLQSIVLAPSLLVFGIFALFRSYKIWGFRALGQI